MSKFFLVLVSIFFSAVFSGTAQKQDLNRVTANDKCNVPITKCSNFMCPKKFCSGELIFEENFNNLDKKIWEPEVTLLGGGVSLSLSYLSLSVKKFNQIENANIFTKMNVLESPKVLEHCGLILNFAK